MRKSLYQSAIAGFFLCAIGHAEATMRCGTSMIGAGDTKQTVLEKCGSPIKQSSEGPARWPNGVSRRNAAEITIFIYGPNGGAYQYLRFIDDKLIDINMKRGLEN